MSEALMDTHHPHPDADDFSPNNFDHAWTEFDRKLSPEMPCYTKEQLHATVDGWYLTPAYQKDLFEAGRGLKLTIVMPDGIHLCGVFEFCVEIIKQCCITCRCNFEDLRVTWFGEEIPVEQSLRDFTLESNNYLTSAGYEKRLGNNATIVVLYNFSWRLAADQSSDVRERVPYISHLYQWPYLQLAYQMDDYNAKMNEERDGFVKLAFDMVPTPEKLSRFREVKGNPSAMKRLCSTSQENVQDAFDSK